MSRISNRKTLQFSLIVQIFFAQSLCHASGLIGKWIGQVFGGWRVMGFFTKFGDGACDLTPLAGLVKGQVREIAAALGAPAQLVKKVPTADLEELKPGKPDEDAYGVTYLEIDAFLQGFEVSEEAARIIVETYDKSRHKREMPKEPQRR